LLLLKEVFVPVLGDENPPKGLVSVFPVVVALVVVPKAFVPEPNGLLLVAEDELVGKAVLEEELPVPKPDEFVVPLNALPLGKADELEVEFPPKGLVVLFDEEVAPPFDKEFPKGSDFAVEVDGNGFD